MAAGGSYASKPRPVLIIQSASAKTGDSVVVIPFTSVKNANIKFREKVIPSNDNGLDRECYLEIDKISAIRISSIGKRIGCLDDVLLRKIESHMHELLEF